MRAPAGSVPFRSPEDVAAAIPAAVAHLRSDGVLAYPTETVYGLGGATSAAAVEALLTLKPRMRGKAILVLVAEREMIAQLGLRLTTPAADLADRFWPGALTLVLPGGERLVPEPLRGPEGGVAVRWTSHPGMQVLIGAFGEPVTSTSANQPGGRPASQAAEVLAEWALRVQAGDLRILDGGPLAPSEPSTVVDCTGRVPRIIRPGAVSAARLRDVVPNLLGDR